MSFLCSLLKDFVKEIKDEDHFTVARNLSFLYHICNLRSRYCVREVPVTFVVTTIHRVYETHSWYVYPGVCTYNMIIYEIYTYIHQNIP